MNAMCMHSRSVMAIANRSMLVYVSYEQHVRALGLQGELLAGWIDLTGGELTL